MGKLLKIGLLGLLVLATVLALGYFLMSADIAVLNPKGVIASHQRDLIVFASLLSLIIVVPVFGLLIGIVWKYRIGNKKAKYTPDWGGDRRLETIWWTIPTLLIVVLSVVTWTSSHDLDPAQPIASDARPLTIQVVALPWKWLFIYPEQNIATVNFVQFPVNRPVHFEITSDAAMNSFWIPQLGGQIYAMAGMSTNLNLMASEAGSFRGSSANISGGGFSGMKFIAKTTSDYDFYQWTRSIQQSRTTLTADGYDNLAKPSQANPPATYNLIEKNLYDWIMTKYTEPSMATDGAGMMPGSHGSMERGMEMR